jgi:hypothetical protein
VKLGRSTLAVLLGVGLVLSFAAAPGARTGSKVVIGASSPTALSNPA